MDLSSDSPVPLVVEVDNEVLICEGYVDVDIGGSDEVREEINQETSTHEELQTILPPGTYKILFLDGNIKTNFRAKIEASMNSKSQMVQWIKEFQAKTNTQYNIRKSTIAGRIYECTIRYGCFRDSGCIKRMKVNDKPSDENAIEKYTNCPATVSMKLYLLEGRHPGACMITINYSHNHETNRVDEFRLLKTNEEIADKFLDLFVRGYSPANALQAHKIDIMIENLENPHILLDRRVMPDYPWVHALFKRKVIKGFLHVANRVEGIQQMTREYEEAGGKIKIVSNFEPIIAVMTPLMRRAIEMGESSEVILLDAAETSSRKVARTYLFLIPTIAGGVPIGAVLSYSDTPDILVKGFHALKSIMPASAFGGKGIDEGPLVFMTHDNPSHKSPLRRLWPKSIILTCVSHLMQTASEFIKCEKSNINIEDWATLLELLKNVLFANDKDEMEVMYQDLRNNVIARKYENYRHYCSVLYKRRKDWAASEHVHLISSDNNLATIAFQIFKDHILDYTRNFKLAQLLDFILKRQDLFYKEKILSVLNCQASKYQLLKCISLSNQVKMDEIVQSTDDVYLCPSEECSSIFYECNMEQCTCSCWIGLCSGMCKHIYAVGKTIDKCAFNISPIEDEEIQTLLSYVANGYQENEQDGIIPAEIPESLIEMVEPDLLSFDLESTTIRQNQLVKRILERDIPYNTAITQQNQKDTCQEKEAKEVLLSICKILASKSKSSPEQYCPALRSMLQNINTMSEKHLINALHNFGGINSDNSQPHAPLKRSAECNNYTTNKIMKLS